MRRCGLWMLSAAMALIGSSAAAADAPLLKNSDFEIDADSDGWPDHWSKLKEPSSWEVEDGNHFIRIKSEVPDQLVMLFHVIEIPAGTKALELGWRWRVTDLKPGKLPWNDARMMLEFSDASGAKLSPQPSPSYSRGTQNAWQTKTIGVLVPEGAEVLKLMPSLFQVTQGTLDLDDLTLRPIDPAPLLAAAREREQQQLAKQVPLEIERRDRWPAEVRVKGNRLVDPEGREVWLQGLNAGGLETLPHDVQPIKSTLVGIEQWKANAVRLPVKEEFWFGRNPLVKDGGTAYRDHIDRCVMIAANRGAYLILDLHRFRAPKSEHAEFWREAAARYKNHPAVLFDLFNEPHDISWKVWRDGGFVGVKTGADESAFLTNDEKLKNQGFESVGMQALVDAVRSTGARNLVIASGLGWSFDLTGVTSGYELSDPSGNGIMYAWHVYNWHKGWEQHMLAAAAKHPILVGEVGADVKKMDFLPHDIQESPETWVPDMLGFIQKHRLNWTAWCFHPRATPVMISDWNYTPTPFWGVHAKEALSGKRFELKKTR
jgi:endoglucanase